MQHCQFYHKSKVKKGKFTHLGGSSVNTIIIFIVIIIIINKASVSR